MLHGGSLFSRCQVNGICYNGILSMKHAHTIDIYRIKVKALLHFGTSWGEISVKKKKKFLFLRKYITFNEYFFINADFSNCAMNSCYLIFTSRIQNLELKEKNPFLISKQDRYFTALNFVPFNISSFSLLTSNF